MQLTTKYLLFVSVVMISLAGCAAQESSKSDGLPLSEIKLDGRLPLVPTVLAEPRYTVKSVEVIVPDTLRISEENLLYPVADIVWRGEPPGDRLAQVKAILNESLAKGTAGLNKGANVVVSVQLERFHALTEKARYWVGGVHDVVFVLTVKDAETQKVLEGPRRVEIAIRAAGNDRAVAEDAAGRTQRVVIIEGVAAAIKRELSVPTQQAAPAKRGLFAVFR